MAHSIADQFLMPLLTVLWMLAMMLAIMIGAVTLMLFGVFFGMAEWLQINIYGKITDAIKNQP
jgi:uncharacterized membrane protein